MDQGSDKRIRFDELLSQFVESKRHFSNSQKEMLLGFREICKGLISVAESAQVTMAGDLPVYVVKCIMAVIDYFLSRFPESGKPSDVADAKIQAISELIEILDEEARRVGKDAEKETDLSKIEAILSIKKYLEAEKEEIILEKERIKKNPRIRKVTIE